MNKLVQRGFDPDKVYVEPEAFIFGSLSQKVIQPDGQWDESLPEFEHQAKSFETYGCTVYGSQNQVEIYLKKVFGMDKNYAERFNYTIIGITPPGANPQLAYQSFRHDGLINQELLPETDTLEEFKDIRKITPKLRSKGKEWGYKLSHEWIRRPSKEDIKEALRYSPIALGVTAWFEEGGLYVDRGQKNTHWAVAYGYIEDEQGIILKIFDSYDKSFKLLHPDHNISIAKRILITKAEPKQYSNNWLLDLLMAFRKGR